MSTVICSSSFVPTKGSSARHASLRGGFLFARNPTSSRSPLLELALVQSRSRYQLHRKRESRHCENRSMAIHRLSTETSVALIMAKTASPFLRFIRFTEPRPFYSAVGFSLGETLKKLRPQPIWLASHETGRSFRLPTPRPGNEAIGNLEEVTGGCPFLGGWPPNTPFLSSVFMPSLTRFG